MRRSLLLCTALVFVHVLPAAAQWTNRYPHVRGYGHHVYLEGYELPSLSSGPLDVRPSPQGTGLLWASEGWLWVQDESGVAHRITQGSGIDARAAWSPDGTQVAFVRDDTRSLQIVLLDVETARERVLVDDGSIVLDPAYSPDGRLLYFASARNGDLDLWAMELSTGSAVRVTAGVGLELSPQPHPDGRRIVYLSKSRAGGDEIRVLDRSTGEDVSLVRGSITSQTRPALSPDGRHVAYNWPTEDGWELRLLAVDAPASVVRLTRARGLPLTPAWDASGEWVYYSEASELEAMEAFRIRGSGGPVERVPLPARDWGQPTGTLRIRALDAQGQVGAARLSVTTVEGHPLIPATGQSRFDGQTGQVFFYASGIEELTVPAGRVRVQAVRGLATPVASVEVEVVAGGTTEASLHLDPVADLRAEGWWSGDHHFHLNYGGLYRLSPEDLEPMARGEDLDVLTPLLANLHTRFEDQSLWRSTPEVGAPISVFGQEVRSHFLGHLGLLGTSTLFWPWVWGPGYEVYGSDDRPNASALQHARAESGMAVYVHPVSHPDPFSSEEALGSIPIEMVADAVLGDLDGIELACLWSDEQGTAAVWHRLLSLGLTVAPTAGTDVMNDFYRTMAVGTTRVYVRPLDVEGRPVRAGTPNFEEYLRGLREGRSFVSNGPLPRFVIGNAEPGEVTAAGRQSWVLELATAVPAERVEILVNGVVRWSDAAPAAPGARRYQGALDLPDGGWVAVRVTGPKTDRWPGMDSYAFAHTAPVWIGARGSTDAAARRQAARDLLVALDAAATRLREGYGTVPTPRIDARFQAARERLQTWSR
ncbi:MAG: CehA/McbA family metallohydrolase [Gemmatimonadota bacterium]